MMYNVLHKGYLLFTIVRNIYFLQYKKIMYLASTLKASGSCNFSVRFTLQQFTSQAYKTW